MTEADYLMDQDMLASENKLRKMKLTQINRSSANNHQIYPYHQLHPSNRQMTGSSTSRSMISPIYVDEKRDRGYRRKPCLWPAPLSTVWHWAHLVLKIFSPAWGLPGGASLNDAIFALLFFGVRPFLPLQKLLLGFPRGRGQTRAALGARPPWGMDTWQNASGRFFPPVLYSTDLRSSVKVPENWIGQLYFSHFYLQKFNQEKNK